MFVSIYKYIVHRLQRMVAGNYIDELHSTIVRQGQELYDLKHTEQSVEKVWVMDAKVYTEFCKEFEPPVINHQNTPTDAAYRLGIQRVLARIGERYVGR